MSGDGLRVGRERAGDATIAVLTLDRPEARNAIDSALLAALDRELAAIAGDAEVDVLILAGSGTQAFSAGMDLKERAALGEDGFLRQHAAIVDLVTRLRTGPVPVIAAVEGYALAGGFELALACDLIVASRTAVFGLPEVRVGMMPGGGATHALPLAVGPYRAREVILGGRRLTAEEAHAWGLVAEVVGPGEALDAARRLAASVAQGSPVAIGAAREAIRGAHSAIEDRFLAEDALYRRVVSSGDNVEGARAFAEKRPPRFARRPRA